MALCGHMPIKAVEIDKLIFKNYKSFFKSLKKQINLGNCLILITFTTLSNDFILF
jgi:hypothetical protein